MGPSARIGPPVDKVCGLGTVVPAEELTVLLLSLLLPAVLLVMLRLLERYERTLDKPLPTDDVVEFSVEAPASGSTGKEAKSA